MTRTELREYKRNWMRRYRQIDYNRVREKMRQDKNQLREVLTLNPEMAATGNCALCRFRKAKIKIERMISTKNGFVSRVIPYCGEC